MFLSFIFIVIFFKNDKVLILYMYVIWEMANIYTNCEITNVHFIYNETNNIVPWSRNLSEWRTAGKCYLNFINVYTTFKKYESNLLFYYGRPIY